MSVQDAVNSLSKAEDILDRNPVFAEPLLESIAHSLAAIAEMMITSHTAEYGSTDGG